MQPERRTTAPPNAAAAICLSSSMSHCITEAAYRDRSRPHMQPAHSTTAPPNTAAVICLSSNSSSKHLGKLCSNSPGRYIGHQASVGQLVPGDRRQGAALQPVLNGSALICVPISCNHRIHHCHLHVADIGFRATVCCKEENNVSANTALRKTPILC